MGRTGPATALRVVTEEGARRRTSIAARGCPLPCPYCKSENTERTAEFGPFHMTEQYHCLDCKSPFSRMRWGDETESTS